LSGDDCAVDYAVDPDVDADDAGEPSVEDDAMLADALEPPRLGAGTGVDGLSLGDGDAVVGALAEDAGVLAEDDVLPDDDGVLAVEDGVLADEDDGVLACGEDDDGALAGTAVGGDELGCAPGVDLAGLGVRSEGDFGAGAVAIGSSLLAMATARAR